MKALIAFIGMAVVILVLIEINERIKAKRPKKDCPKEKPEQEDCSGCGLAEVCESREARHPDSRAAH